MLRTWSTLFWNSLRSKFSRFYNQWFEFRELDSRVNKGSADKKVSEAEASVTEDYIDVVDQEDDIDVVGHESDMDVVGHEASNDAGKNHLTGNAFTVGRRRRAADPEEQIEKPKKVAALSLGTRTWMRVRGVSVQLSSFFTDQMARSLGSQFRRIAQYIPCFQTG